MFKLLTVLCHSSKRFPCVIVTAILFLLFIYIFFPYQIGGFIYGRSLEKLSFNFKNYKFEKLPEQKLNSSQYSTNEPTTPWDEFGCQSKTPLLLCHRTPELSPAIVLADKAVFQTTSLLMKRSRSCALVGSSGRLLSRRYGNDIDGHDVVIRLNNAPIHPYEKYVGRRMPDVAILNVATLREFTCLRNVNRKTLLVRCKHHGKITSAGRLCARHGPLYATSVELMNTTRSILTTYRQLYGVKSKRMPTSGLYAILFVLRLCEEVDVYGFGAAEAELYAYYRDIHTFSTHHLFNLEEQFIRDISHNLTTPVDMSSYGCKKVSFHP